MTSTCKTIRTDTVSRRLLHPSAPLSSGGDVRVGVVAAVTLLRRSGLNGRALELGFYIIGGQGGETVSLRLTFPQSTATVHRFIVEL